MSRLYPEESNRTPPVLPHRRYGVRQTLPLPSRTGTETMTRTRSLWALGRTPPGGVGTLGPVSTSNPPTGPPPILVGASSHCSHAGLTPGSVLRTGTDVGGGRNVVSHEHVLELLRGTRRKPDSDVPRNPRATGRTDKTPGPRLPGTSVCTRTHQHHPYGEAGGGRVSDGTDLPLP